MATPAIMRDFERDTLWRQARLCHWDAMERISDKGPCINGIFSAPGFTRDCCFMDWLHWVDSHTNKVKFGMLFGPEFLGQSLLAHMAKAGFYKEGRNCGYFSRGETVVWRQRCCEQIAHPAGPRPFCCLALIHKTCLFLVSYLLGSLWADWHRVTLLPPACWPRFAKQHLTSASSTDQSIIACAEELRSIFFAEFSCMSSHCIRFSLLYKALEQQDVKLWIIKPQFHQWCYGEETSVFSAQTSRRWGVELTQGCCHSCFAKKSS